MSSSPEVVDRLESLLARFSLRAQAFHSGNICGINDLVPEGDAGTLHLIKQGRVEIHHGGAVVERVEVPSLLLYPRALPHRLVADDRAGADLTCAHLRFEGGASHPVAGALPPWVCLPLDAVDGLDKVLQVLFEEAFDQRCGRRAILDRLFEVVLVQVLRHLMEDGRARVGLLSGLAHPRLRRALVAMHERPAEDWSLERLASQAGMSRSVFANAFRDAVGCTPGAYLQQWRVTLVKQALREGRSLKWAVDAVGYGSEAALSRAFKAQVGQSPREWKRGTVEANPT